MNTTSFRLPFAKFVVRSLRAITHWRLGCCYPVCDSQSNKQDHQPDQTKQTPDALQATVWRPSKPGPKINPVNKRYSLIRDGNIFPISQFM
jgi:hypothetical protein